jgi:flagellar biosynthesis protein FlhF
MMIQRFNAATSREALAKARMTFGDGTVILSNRPTATGVEVMATGEDALAALDQVHQATAQPVKAPAAAPKKQMAAVPKQSPNNRVEDDADQLAMSTLSFQDYVRERMLARRSDSLKFIEPHFEEAPAAPRKPQNALSNAKSQEPLIKTQPMQKPVKPAAVPVLTNVVSEAVPQGIAGELQAMKEMIEERFSTFAWLGQTKQHPILSNLMLKLIRAGYSPSLARTVLSKLPEEANAGESMRWMIDVLERNLRTDAHSVALHEGGGVHALVGATGVGKTTTAAKLAGMCARLHGAASVGLITLDTYRIGAHEQLRNYGRMLGVVAHLAHDRAALQDLLNLLANKKMVIIDTTGLAPRDAQKREMLDAIELPSVNRLLVLNAVSHGDTQDEAIAAFSGPGVQQTILTKIDEAVKIGPTLDACMRHQLLLRGVTTGQKAPQDWESADATKLIRMSMRSSGKSAFDPQIADLGFFFSEPAGSSPTQYHA